MSQTLILTGDLSMRNAPDPGTPIEKGDNDVLFGNLEGCLFEADYDAQHGVSRYKGTTMDISQSPPTKSRRYDASPEAARQLANAGFDAVGCANNVTYGEYAIPASLARLDEAGIAHSGAGINRDAARAPALVEKNGVRFGFLQYTCEFFPVGHEATETSPGVATIRPHTAYQPDPRIHERAGGAPTVITWPDPTHLHQMSEDISALDDRVDMVIASYHWGLGGTNDPIQYQVDIAHTAIDSGADIVMGHGPHVLQSIELYQGSPIFYSLGDFIGQSQRVGLVVRAELSGKRVNRVTCSPTRPNTGGQPMIRPTSEEKETVDLLLRVSEELGTCLNESGESVVVWESGAALSRETSGNT